MLLRAVVANDRLEPFIYAGSRGVLPEKHSSRKRDLFSKNRLTLLLSLLIYVMSDARYVQHNMFTPEVRLAAPVKIGAVFLCG